MNAKTNYDARVAIMHAIDSMPTGSSRLKTVAAILRYRDVIVDTLDLDPDIDYSAMMVDHIGRYVTSRAQPKFAEPIPPARRKVQTRAKKPLAAKKTTSRLRT